MDSGQSCGFLTHEEPRGFPRVRGSVQGFPQTRVRGGRHCIHVEPLELELVEGELLRFEAIRIQENIETILCQCSYCVNLPDLSDPINEDGVRMRLRTRTTMVGSLLNEKNIPHKFSFGRLASTLCTHSC